MSRRSSRLRRSPDPVPEPQTTWASAGAAVPTTPLDRPAWAPPKTKSTRRTLPSAVKTIGALLLVVAVFVSGIAVGKGDAPSTGQSTGAAGVPASLPPQFATYLEAWKILQDNYVDPAALDPTKLTYGSVNGLVEAVGDTGHTRFLTPDEVKDQHTSLSGSIVGIGALMNTETACRSSSRSSRVDRPTGPVSGGRSGPERRREVARWGRHRRDRQADPGRRRHDREAVDPARQRVDPGRLQHRSREGHVPAVSWA